MNLGPTKQVFLFIYLILISTLAYSACPTIYHVTGGGAYCSGGSGVAIGLDNSEIGITYTLKRGSGTIQTRSGTGSALTFSNQAVAGTYTVTATDGSCVLTMNGNATIAVNSNPSIFSMTGGGSYCQGGTGIAVKLSGSQSGVNYQLFLAGSPVGSPVAGTGGIISFGLKTTTGNYTATATNATTLCSSNMSGSAIVSTVTPPTAYNVTGGGAYCSGGAGLAIGLANSDIGITYTLMRGATTIQSLSGNGSALTFNNQTVAGTYTVTGTNGGCTVSMNGNATVTINSKPTVYAMSGGGGYCTGGTGVTVGLTGSQSGVSYQLLLSGSPVGSPVAGTGAAISFGLQTTTGNYTATATNTSTLCTSNMSGIAVVSTDTPPTAYNVTGGGSYCSGGTGLAIGLNNSATGITYTLMRGATTIQNLSGTGSALNFNNQTVAGTYTVTGTNGSCTVSMTGSASITIIPKPTVYAMSGGGGYCPGGTGVSVGLTGSQSGVDYQLLLSGSPVGSPVAGTGSAISFGIQTAAGNYTATATNTSTLCTANMSGTATVSINPSPTAYNVTGGGAYCSGGAGVAIGLANSDIGVTYTLKRGSGNLQTLNGTGSALTFSNQIVAGTYTVFGSNGGCPGNMNGNATVTVNPPPSIFTMTGGGRYCPGGSGVAVGLTGSHTGFTYQLLLAGSPVGSPIAGTGAIINFGLKTATGNYTAVATNTTTSCTANMSGTSVVSTYTPPTAYTVTGGGAYCSGGTGVAIGLSNSDAGFNYQLFNGGTPIGSAIGGTGSSINFGNHTGAGTYTVIATDATTLCTATMNGNATVIINTPSTPTITPDKSTNLCSGDTVTLTSSSGISYLWSSGDVTRTIRVSNSGSFTVTVTDVNGCVATSAPTSVTVNSCTFTWTGFAGTDWNTGANWDLGFVPNSQDDALIPTGVSNTPIVSISAVIRNLTIASGATLTLNNGSVFSIYGDLHNNGTLTDNGGTTNFSGTTAQTISGVTTSFANLTQNNPSVVILNSSCFITGILSLPNGVLNSNGNLNVDLNTGSIAYNAGDNGSISGNIRILKNVNCYKTHYLSCPLSGVTDDDFNDNTPIAFNNVSRLFYWNFPTQTWTPINSLSVPLQLYNGYSLYFQNPNTLLDFTGTYTHNSSTYSSSVNSTAASQSILIGNPYPSTLDWESSGWGLTNLKSSITMWNACTGKFATYTLGGTSINGGTRYIPAMQAFYVKSLAAGTSTLSADNSVRTTAVNPSILRKAAATNTIKLTLSSGIYDDETIVRFSDNAIDGFDNGLDADKFKNPDLMPSFYSVTENNEYAINTLKTADEKIIPLNIEAGFSGTYTISAQETAPFDSPYTLVLKDKLLKTTTDILSSPYTFSTNPGEGLNRFSLIYRNASPGQTAGSLEASVSITGYGKTLTINCANLNSEANYYIYNSIGELVGSGVFDASQIYTNSINTIATGIYVVKVVTANTVYSAKIFLNE